MERFNNYWALLRQKINDYIKEKKISQIEETLCKGCGACVAACSCGASSQNAFTNEQLMAEIDGALV